MANIQISKVLDMYGKPFTYGKVSSRKYNSRLAYDAAKDIDALVNYWANTDHLSPSSANRYSIRRKLRSRSRYELGENSSFLNGIMVTIANDTVKSGPKCKITDRRLSPVRRTHIGQKWMQWCKKIKYRQKLWQSFIAYIMDGEAFRVRYNDFLVDHPVKLNIAVLEADYFHNPELSLDKHDEADGIRYTPDGLTPVAYYKLDVHPGAYSVNTNFLNGQWLPAKYVTHWFRKLRGWRRGIPILTPSLPLCAYTRRYVHAVVKAAETSADFAAVLESTQNDFGGAINLTQWSGDATEDNDDIFDQFPIEQGMFTVLPPGKKLGQLKAEYPSQHHAEFLEIILREIVRPLLVPFHRSAGTSKDSNMASASVDEYIYKDAREMDRLFCEEEVVEPDFEEWWKEAIRIDGYLTEPIIIDGKTVDTGNFILENFSLLNETPEHRWRWDIIGREHSDPLKVASALEKLGPTGTGYLTDGDIQEKYFNKDEDVWRGEIEGDLKFRQDLPVPALASDGTETTKDQIASHTNNRPPTNGNRVNGQKTNKIRISEN